MNETPQQERESLTRKILSEAPRMKVRDKFNFCCHSGVSCFNVCCSNVNIVLAPFDILRMSRRLDLTTTDFLARHTFIPFSEEVKLPFVFLKMQGDKKKTCPFVTEAGCSIYSDRPWPCRMYPVGSASPADPEEQGEEFFFLISEDHCKGHGEKREWAIEEYMGNQGVDEYERMGESFKQILLKPKLADSPLDPARMEMFYMACYDLDKFREFVFESKFLERFEIEPEDVEAIRSEDTELLRFAFRWLSFALFGETTIKINPKNLSQRERALFKDK